MTTETKTYNGWTNYETWNVKLWMDNEEPSYRYWQEFTQEVWDAAEAGGVFTRSEDARYRLADRLKEEITDGSPLIEAPSMYSDLLGAALCEVNWEEIANALLVNTDIEEYEDVGTEHAPEAS